MRSGGGVGGERGEWVRQEGEGKRVRQGHSQVWALVCVPHSHFCLVLMQCSDGWSGGISSRRSSDDDQKSLIEGLLNSSTATIKIVVGHHPVRSP